MAELRYNPLTNDWTMVASHRQNRPQMPKDWCPFCIGSGKVPENYDVYIYDNDFPALMEDPEEDKKFNSNIYKTEKSYGKCEVVLYSPQHDAKLWELSTDHVNKLVDLWTDRYRELSKNSKHKYILIFENRGELVGVTMPHPHGQIYAYPFIPQKIKIELDNCKNYYKENKKCLICEITKEELRLEDRIIIENEDFITYIPFFSDYPYGMFIASKKHRNNLLEFSENERRNLGLILKETVGTMDELFHMEFPYMMGIHQGAVNSEDSSDYYHFHIEFYPPMRSKDKVKFNASSEVSVGAVCNPRSVEETSRELREAYKRYKSVHD
ncbi:galactose-1-phosphate uridylyltransferase [Clostridium hydrogeniformans]|uniref:galactose-1-phosphate uridylyltransferase n=1 Tax=Clostridium hydrogeniformans TaxID=349933 RepID=UPI0004837A81|nr:galactose-1-phosphate uridylyltransferase [Clostridium hydrogeniformans]